MANQTVPTTKEKATRSKGRIAWRWYFLLFVVAAWMFILGILVGRGTAPIHFDTLALQKELAQLRASMVKKERENVEKAIRGEDKKTPLEFYEALKKDEPDTTFHPREKTTVDPSKPHHKTRSTELTKKKAQAAVITEQSPSLDAAPLSKGKLAIQVASLKDIKAAEGIVADLKKAGYSAYLSKTIIEGKGLWFRVRVGNYQSKEQANADIVQLERDRRKPILVEVERN